MSWIVGILSVFLVLACLLLMLLVLVQLPKKEAGMGQAFGGGATDALFGAGSGNVLTKVTKYGTGVFLVIALALSVMNNYQAREGQGGKLGEIMKNTPAPITTPPPPAPAP